MSFEDKVKLKHAVEDSFRDLLSYTAALTDRELEIAAAKIADAISEEKKLGSEENLMIVGRVLQIVLQLRQSGETRQNKSKRIWYSMRKSSFLRAFAETKLAEYIEEHNKCCAEVDRRNRRRNAEYQKELSAIRKKRATVPFLKRLINGPRLPSAPIVEAYPTTPNATLIQYKEFGSSFDIGELLIKRVVGHKFPHLEAASDFVSEENMKSIESRLLEKD